MKNFLLVVFFCVGTVTALAADPVMGFEDLPYYPGDPGHIVKTITNGYHLLNWSGFVGIDASSPLLGTSGMQVADVSPVTVLYNPLTTNASISGPMFDLLSVYATSDCRDDLQLETQGYFKGTLLYDQTNVLSATQPTLIQFNYYGVDDVHFISSTGTHHAGYSCGSPIFILDDLKVVTYLPYVDSSSLSTTNGGFETGGFYGWRTNGNLNVTIETNYVHSGRFGGKIGPALTPVFLAETNAAMDVGRPYTVSFWIRNLAASPNYFLVSWNGVPIMAVTNLPASEFTNYQFDVTAWSRNDLLQFQFQSDASMFALDDVTVTPKVLVTNGGFETGDFSGWTHLGDTNDDHVNVADLLIGSYGADFGAVNTLGTIAQPIATQPGQPYLISAWVKNNDGDIPTTEFHVSWDGEALLDETNLPVAGWTNLHFIELSRDTQSTLQFGLRNDSDFFLFDEVSVYPVPILQNGGFEFGDFTGWALNGNLGYDRVTLNSSFVSSGFYGSQFDPIGAPEFLSQSFATLPGQSYVIGFTLYNQSPLTNAEFSVSWNDTVLMDMTNSSLVGQVPYQFVVTAAATNSTLQFGFRNDTAFFGLDDVYVSPIQTPALQAIKRDNNNLVNVSWSALAGYGYDLQYKTNLTQPNWNSVHGLQTPTSLPMIGTDTNPPDPRRFYRVQMFPPP